MRSRAGNSLILVGGDAPGFTLVEVIVVTVLLVVLAAVMAPRVLGNEDRRARITAEAVRDLLSAAGEREALTSQAVTIAFDADAPGGGRLSILTTPASGGAPAPDPVVLPVSLDGLEMERCTAAGSVLNRRRWQVPLEEGDIRPSVSLVLRQADGGGWLVNLPAEGLGATLSRASEAGDTPAAAGAIDLDQARGRDEPW